MHLAWLQIAAELLLSLIRRPLMQQTPIGCSPSSMLQVLQVLQGLLCCGTSRCCATSAHILDAAACGTDSRPAV
jgi:hypothetical protein